MGDWIWGCLLEVLFCFGWSNGEIGWIGEENW